jgi:hypothetical protein
MELLPLQLLEATKHLQYDDKKVTLRGDLLGEETQQNKQKLHGFLIIINIQ